MNITVTPDGDIHIHPADTWQADIVLRVLHEIDAHQPPGWEYA